VTEYCPKCRQKVEAEHSEIECLRGQVTVLTADRDSWKEAWWDQRRATGYIAWQWKEPWMRPHLEYHLGIEPCCDPSHSCPACGFDTEEERLAALTESHRRQMARLDARR
jgi:hypothetical protein